nr:hypothetical protein CFP56_21907 [Quercus suber]
MVSADMLPPSTPSDRLIISSGRSCAAWCVGDDKTGTASGAVETIASSPSPPGEEGAGGSNRWGGYCGTDSAVERCLAREGQVHPQLQPEDVSDSPGDRYGQRRVPWGAHDVAVHDAVRRTRSTAQSRRQIHVASSSTRRWLKILQCVPMSPNSWVGAHVVGSCFAVRTTDR